MAKRKKSPPAPNSGGAGKETLFSLTPPELGVVGGLHRWLLAALVLTYLVLAVGYSAVTPVATADQHNPDENAHMQYVATLASGHLPVFTDVQHGYENHQPPLYYALCAPVYLAAQSHGAAAATKAVRWVSILLGALLILVTYCCITTLVPENPWLALGTATFVGLLPSNVALSASVTNDVLTNLVMAVGLWLLTKFVQSVANETNKGEAVWLGVVLGIGLWTKTSALLLFPTVLFAFYLLARQKLLPTPLMFRSALVALGVGTLLGAPWLLRNQMLYGDPLAHHIFVSAFSQTAQADIITHFLFHDSLPGYLGGVARWTFASFWGGFDSGLIFWGQNPHERLNPAAHGAYGIYGGLPPAIYMLPALLVIASIIGLIRLRQTKASSLTPQQSILACSFALLIFLMSVVFLRFILTFFQAQGRYFYPALLPLTFFFVWGWCGLLPRPGWFPAFVGLIVAALVVLNAYTLFGLLLPRFSMGILP